jgi:Ca2+-binding RTX toxin-like protein
MESVELTDLESSTTYLVTVRAFDAAGNLGAPSAYAGDRTKDLPDDIAPSAVPNFTLRSVSRSTLEVAWGAATDNVRVAGYSLSLNGGPEVATGDSVTDFTFRNISPDTDYSISIRAKDLVGNVGPAQTIMATTPPIDPACARNTADVWRARGWRVIVGTPGNDVLQGTAAREVFIGGSGDDVIYARGGDDLICAGTGADVVRAGPGADQIHTADRDRDQIYGGLGRDRAWIDGGGEGVIRSVRLLNAL